METNIIKIQKTKFKNYIKELFEFDKEINDEYQKAQKKIITKDNGYLIDKKCFDDFKNKLSYSKFKSLNEPDFSEKMDKIFAKIKEIEYIPFKPKTFNTSKELIDSLSKNNVYIIINSKLLEKINGKKYDKEQEKISYEIKENELIINIKAGEKAHFKHNLNIIKYDILLSRSGINAEDNRGKRNDNINNQNIFNKDKSSEAKKKEVPVKLIDIKGNFEQNLIAIEALFEIYKFTEELKNQLKEDLSQVFEGKCYLIKEKWLSKFQNFYLYEKIQSEFKKGNESQIQSISKQIYDKYNEKFINIHKNNNEQAPLFLEDETNLIFKYKLDNNTGKIEFSDKYSIINEKIFHKIISPKFKKDDIEISEYYINNKKFIMKIQKKCIIIGELTLSDNNYILNPEILLQYNEEEISKKQFEVFKNPVNDIKNILEIKNEITQEIKSKDSKEVLGKIFFFKKQQHQNDNNNTSIDYYIKILLRIFYNYEYINQEIKKYLKTQKFETCYIVNEKYINRLKELLNYKEFCKKKLKEKFDEYFTKSNNFNELLNNIDFVEEIKKELIQTEFFKFLNSIQNKAIDDIKMDDKLTKMNKINFKNEVLYYYKNFEIISNDFYQFLKELKLTSNEERFIKSKCLYGENKILLHSCHPEEKKSLIIVDVNHSNEFISELILSFDNSNFFDEYIKEIQSNGYKKNIAKLNFNNDEATIFQEETNKGIGKAYKIIGKEELKLYREMEDEIFIIIKIYLFNLDLQNSISLSIEHASSSNYEKYTQREKCYLVNKEWMSEYKNYYFSIFL